MLANRVMMGSITEGFVERFDWGIVEGFIHPYENELILYNTPMSGTTVGMMKPFLPLYVDVVMEVGGYKRCCDV